MNARIVPFDFQGQAVTFNGDGWINATEAAARFGKRVDHWLANAETQQYIEALAAALNTRDSGVLIRSRRGRNGGTWLHPKLAISFARWLNVDFAVWCDLHIDALLRGELSEKQQFAQACKRLADAKEIASLSGHELANHRWRKPNLERDVEHWDRQLRLMLGEDAA